MKKFWKYFFWTLGLFALAILSLSWQSSAPAWLNLLSWPLLAMLIFSWFKGNDNLLWPALILGLFLDLMSFGFFGWNMIIWPLLVLLSRFLSLNLFSSRSAYSYLLLVMVLTLVYYILLSLAAYFFFFQSNFPLFSAWYWRNIVLAILENTAVLFVFFLFVRKRRRHFDLA